MEEIKKENLLQLLSFLTHSSIISAKDEHEITEIHNSTGKNILHILKDKYAIEENFLANKISENYGSDRVDLNKTNYLENEEILRVLPKNFNFIENIIPFDISPTHLKIAIADPSKFSVANNLAKTLKRKASIYIDTFTSISSAVNKLKAKYYDLETGKTSKEVDEARTKLLAEEEEEIRKAMENNEIQLSVKEEAIEEEVVIDENAREGAIFLVNQIISRAINVGASDIHIEMFKTKARIRFRKEGILEEQVGFKNLKETFNAIVSRIKILSELNIAERRLPQDGALEFKWKNRTVDLRVSILPTSYGERVVMRILDKGAIQLDLDTLGIPERELKLIKRSIHMPKGLALVTGPTGSGKTTTLYSCLADLNKPDINILTAEDPIEYGFEGIGQVKVNNAIGYTFAEALKSFLRQDPEVIMVGEIRDKETVEIAIKAALTGHFVLSTLHTNDAPSTVMRLINMGVERYILTSALVMILAQRLIKKNCPMCLVDDEELNIEELQLVGFTEDEIATTDFKKGKGCPHCNKSGYKGRKGIYEVFTLNDTLREVILTAESTEEIKNAAIKTGFMSMQLHGKELIKQGILSIEEYKRVLLTE